MKVLIYDNNPKDLEKLCELLHCVPLDMEVDKLSDVKDFKTIYEKHDYNVLFIDQNDQHGYELVEFVRERDPKQRIVNINNSLSCCMSGGCDICQDEFNGFRIVKPVEILDVVDALKKKECRFDCKNPLMIKLSIISKALPFFKFDKENLKFYHEHTNFEHRIVELTSKLEEYNIDYEINENYLQIIAE